MGGRVPTRVTCDGCRAGRRRRGRRRLEGDEQPAPFSLVAKSIYRRGSQPLTRVDDRAARCDGEGSVSCDENRALGCECENGVCGNRTVQRRAFKRTTVQKGHGQWALIMEEDGAKGDVVEEYVGECLREEQFRERWEATQEKERVYFCALLPGLVVDATHYGSFARFVNHHCDANAVLAPLSVCGERRIVVRLEQDVTCGEEVTVRYGFEDGEFVQRCWCGGASCQGWIHRLPASRGEGDEGTDAHDEGVRSQCRH